MRTAVTTLCGFTMLASCWLFVMFLVLRGFVDVISLALMLQAVLTLVYLLRAAWWPSRPVSA